MHCRQRFSFIGLDPLARGIVLAAFGLMFLGCSSGGGNGTAGDPCTTPSDCGDERLCFCAHDPEDPEADCSRALCMDTCESGDRICGGAEPCLANQEMTSFVCYIGGTIDLGQPCTSTRECNSGVCVDVGGDLRCYQACVVGDNAPCGSGEECLPVEGTGTNGFCSTPPTSP